MIFHTRLIAFKKKTKKKTDHLNGQYSFLVTITKADSFMLGVLLSNADVANVLCHFICCVLS